METGIHANRVPDGVGVSGAERLARRLDGGTARGFTFLLGSVDLLRTRTGWARIGLAVRDRTGRRSIEPVVTGIVSGGGRGVKPWVECRLSGSVEMEGGARLDAYRSGLVAATLKLLADCIAPGGHLMVDYESRGHDETLAALARRVPPAATLLGALMVEAGFIGGFKDWYFAEGGHEGPRKLQAEKPPDAKAARTALRRRCEELREFLGRPMQAEPACRQIIVNARRRAARLLSRLEATPAPRR